VVTTHVDRRTVVDRLSFGEGPRWHDGSLFLSDMHNHRVLRVDAREADPTVETIAQHDSALSGLGWLPDGALLVLLLASSSGVQAAS
jgi:hypothetical protein